MKLNMHVNKSEINGYININLATDNIDFNNMNNICEPSECTELILDEIFHYIPLQKIPPLLSKLTTRLRRMGKIIVMGYDVNECIKMYQNGRMSIADLNLVLFGQEGLHKNSCISHREITQILVENGLQINSVQLNVEKFIIIGKRP